MEKLKPIFNQVVRQLYSKKAEISFLYEKGWDDEDGEWMHFVSIYDHKTKKYINDFVGIYRKIEIDRLFLAFSDPDKEDIK